MAPEFEHESEKGKQRPVVAFSLELSLADIPEPLPCVLCGAPQQKEFVLWQTSSASVTVDAGPTPGYGCTECGAKSFPMAVTLQLLDRAAQTTRTAGDGYGADCLEAELHDLQERAHSHAQ